MDDMTAFERLVAGRIQHHVGAIRPVDDLAIYESITATSRSPRWGFTMFSALKFVAAAAIVALFGGFLLAGVLTTQQGDEMAPAAVTASPSPTTTEELLSGMVTEEVEPGVFRVTSDGVRDLTSVEAVDVVAGYDDGIWLLREADFLRLGGDTAHEWASRGSFVYDFEVAPDGTVWMAQVGDEYEVWSYDGEGWTTDTDTGVLGARMTPDGSVWSTRLGPPESDPWGTFGYQDADGWHRVGDIEPCMALMVAGSEDIWALGCWGVKYMLFHWVDGEWQETESHILSGDIGPEGTVWGVDIGPENAAWGVDSNQRLVRFVEGERTEWSLHGSGLLPDLDEFWVEENLPIGVSRDGTVWLGGLRSHDAEEVVCGGGLGHFDGVTWDRHLEDLCVSAIDIATDGSVWVLADRDRGRGLYVITPEAVAE